MHCARLGIEKVHQMIDRGMFCCAGNVTSRNTSDIHEDHHLLLHCLCHTVCVNVLMKLVDCCSHFDWCPLEETSNKVKKNGKYSLV